MEHITLNHPTIIKVQMSPSFPDILTASWPLADLFFFSLEETHNFARKVRLEHIASRDHIFSYEFSFANLINRSSWICPQDHWVKRSCQPLTGVCKGKELKESSKTLGCQILVMDLFQANENSRVARTGLQCLSNRKLPERQLMLDDKEIYAPLRSAVKFHPLISSWNHCTPPPSRACNDSTKRSRDEIPLDARSGNAALKYKFFQTYATSFIFSQVFSEIGNPVFDELATACNLPKPILTPWLIWQAIPFKSGRIHSVVWSWRLER